MSLSCKKLEIEHIGSTSVPGLGGKGIIDFSIGIHSWRETEPVLKILRELGFKHFHEIENHSLFVSSKEKCDEGEFHIHISRIGTKKYRGTLAFRDFLRQNPDEARKYDLMKKEIFRQSRGDRTIYKRLKADLYFSKH